MYTLILQTVDFHRHRMKQINNIDFTDVMKHYFLQEIVNKLQNVNYNDLVFTPTSTTLRRSVVKSSKLRCAIFLPKSAKKGATQFFSESAKNFGQKRPKFEFFLAGIKLKMPHLTIFIAFLYDNILTKRNSWFFPKKSFKIGHF